MKELAIVYTIIANFLWKIEIEELYYILFKLDYLYFLISENSLTWNVSYIKIVNWIVPLNIKTKIEYLQNKYDIEDKVFEKDIKLFEEHFKVEWNKIEIIKPINIYTYLRNDEIIFIQNWINDLINKFWKVKNFIETVKKEEYFKQLNIWDRLFFYELEDKWIMY